jgi:hypothetical protein
MNSRFFVFWLSSLRKEGIMRDNGKENNIVDENSQITLKLVENLARHWDGNIFNRLRLPDYPYITPTQGVGMYMWKFLIEEDMDKIIKHLNNGGSRDKETK